MLKRLLPMVGHTRGNRSPVTCELKCGSACAHPEPNTSDNLHFQDIANAAFSRRAALGVGGGLAAAVVIGTNTVGNAPAAVADHGTFPKGGGKPVAPDGPDPTPAVRRGVAQLPTSRGRSSWARSRSR